MRGIFFGRIAALNLACELRAALPPSSLKDHNQANSSIQLKADT